MIIEYKDFLLTDEQISAATEFVGRRNLRLYIKEHNARPSDIEPFFVLTDEEKERYRRVEYARYLYSYEGEPGEMDFSNNHTRLTAVPGDVVYISGTPVGIVVISVTDGDGIGRMASLPNMSRSNPREGNFKAGITSSADADYRMCLYANLVDIEGLPNCSTQELAIADMDGKGNTEAILAFQTYYTDFESIEVVERYKSSPAAVACHLFRTVGTEMGDWYLPSIGEMYKIIPYISQIVDGYDVLNEGLYDKSQVVPTDTVLNAVPFADINNGNYGGNFGQWYWSSTEQSETTAWYLNSLNKSISYRNKNNENSWGEIKAFCHF